MTLLTLTFLMEKYGVRVNLEVLAVILDTTPGNLRRRISLGDLEIPTYLDSGRRWADIRDVAHYLDACRQNALEAHRTALGAYPGV